MSEQQDFDFSITEEEFQEFQHLVECVENADSRSFVDLAQELDLSLKDDFVAANFAGIDFSSANLRDANFSYSNFSDANLSGANLSGVNLSGANLSNADLNGANLSGANLSNADLNGANLSGANLSGVNLSGTNIKGVDLSYTSLNVANLWHTNYNSTYGTAITLNLVGMETQPQQPFRARRIIKGCIDIIGATIILILTAPVIISIAIAIKVDSPGPIFFRQKRIGLHGKEFLIWKFRTMIPDAEKALTKLEPQKEMKDGVFFKMKSDPRVTKVGKFLRLYSLDELPQLFNVLLGEMSLIGPRPLPIRDAEKLQTKHFVRQEVLPGITGLSQVSGRADIDNFEDWVKVDIEYIENWSLWLDMKILLGIVNINKSKTFLS
ncbi:MAG: sugar transferase [Cyanobacteria bacterium P01_H01_bin.150]